MDPEINQVGSRINEIATGIQSQGLWDYTKDFFATHQHFLYNLGRIIVLCLVIFLLARLAIAIVKKLIEKSIEKIGAMDEAIGRVILNIAKTLIWIIAGLIALDLFGFNTASILTVLGAAGLAIGLAMKDSLSNIAAGIMLLILHPYKGGDFIECGSVSGVIKELGLFTTTLQTVDGIFVSVPNSVLFGSPIKNYSHNSTRRADITVGIAYSDNLADGLKVLGEMLNSNERILKDPAPQVVVSDLADSSVNLTLRFWATNQNYWDVYWQIKAQLKGVLEGAGLNIPFPQRVVTFANSPSTEGK